MLKIKRLNLDSSWQITWNGTSILLDPWLVGSEIDYFSAFNEQWHTTTPTKIEELESYDTILISQHFSDHCHEETLKLLHNKHIITTPKGAQRVKKSFPAASIQVLPSLSKNEWLKFKSLEISWLPAPKKLSASFSGIVIRSQNDAIVYFPHGYDFTNEQLEIITSLNVLVLITSLSSFKLPFFLGGFVNPGLKHAEKLIAQIKPKHLIATHDENKKSRGIVKKIAKVNYPLTKELSEQFPNLFVDLHTVNQIFEINSTHQ